MEFHDLVLVVGLAALAMIQLLIRKDFPRRAIARRSETRAWGAAVRTRLGEDVPSRWPRA